MAPTVSIVIPCYNHGQYLEDALGSLDNAAGGLPIEVLIVNDGSTEAATQEKLRELEGRGYRVLHKENGGLASARNAGIAASSAPLILPLDSDNKLTPGSLPAAVAVFDAQPGVGVVYGDRELFEAATGRVAVGDFNLQKLMLTNYIDACAMYRRTVWEAVGGYDQTMPYTGWEDWEFWLHAAFKGTTFHYLPQVLFDYRVVATSMIHGLNKSKRKLDALLEHLEQRHPHHFGTQHVDAYFNSKFTQAPGGAWAKLVLKRFFPAVFEKWVARGKLRRYW